MTNESPLDKAQHRADIADATVAQKEAAYDQAEWAYQQIWDLASRGSRARDRATPDSQLHRAYDILLKTKAELLEARSERSQAHRAWWNLSRH